jgi:hypothetical protein
MSTPVTVGLVALAAAVAAILGKQLPEIRRYLKIRSM